MNPFTYSQLALYVERHLNSKKQNLSDTLRPTLLLLAIISNLVRSPNLDPPMHTGSMSSSFFKPLRALLLSSSVTKVTKKYPLTASIQLRDATALAFFDDD